MIRYLLPFVLICILSSCSVTNYIQLYKTEAPGMKTDGSSFVYDNDTVSISYVLWADSGVLSYSLYNKTDRPIYVDWHRSDMILNGEKLDYWQDKTVSSSVTNIEYGYSFVLPSLRGYYYPQTLLNNGQSTRLEKVTFIPPHSYVYRSEYTIARKLFNNWGDDYRSIMVKSYTHPKRLTKVFMKDFDKTTTPYLFRNYLTLSYDEAGTQSFAVDNTFYVSQVQTIRENDIAMPYYDNGVTKVEMKFVKGTWFYRAPHLATAYRP